MPSAVATHPFELEYPNVFNFLGYIGATFRLPKVQGVFFTLGLVYSDSFRIYFQDDWATCYTLLSTKKFLSTYSLDYLAFETAHNKLITSFLDKLIILPFSNINSYYTSTFFFDLARFFDSETLRRGINPEQIVQHPRFQNLSVSSFWLQGYKAAKTELAKSANTHGKEYLDVFNLL